MKILALGGTQFVGRGFVEAALVSGHEVTIVHRGKSEIPAGWNVSEILADRNGGLGVLSEGKWDAVYDSCAYVPRQVREAVETVGDRVGRYLFISTISVFDPELNYMHHDTPLDTEHVTGETYGPLKVECEEALAALGSKATVVRPGLVYGPFDKTFRWPYWIDRFDRFEEVVVPDVDGPFQQIDARDLGAFCLRLLEADRAGVFEAAGEQTTFFDALDVCARQGKGKPIRVPVSALEEQGIGVGSDLPLAWGDSKLMTFPCTEALAAGLSRRPIEETCRDTLVWTRTLEPFGLARERELAVLQSLK
jgi:2'-hydroxyisoflavone reductase